MQGKGRKMVGWGKHLVLDARSCDVTKATDPEYIKQFTKDLVVLIDMIPYGEPQIVHFADGDEKAGWTMIQLIETSNIMGHFLDINGDLYLDIFSCKDYDENNVIEFLRNRFEPEKIYSQVLIRDARR